MSSKEILKRIKACRDPRRLAVLVSGMEDIFTPLEFAGALERSRPLADDHPLARTIIRRQLSSHQPERYLRRAISDDIMLYSSLDHPRSQKTLILGWTGRGFRLGLPIVSFVQMLPCEQFDVVVLRDRHELSFIRGVEGYADGLPALVSRLRTELRFPRYGGVATFGVSSGGPPALRAAHLLSAERGVSIGGLFHWHVLRMLAGLDSQAFDILCACRAPSRTRLIGVYGENSERDRLHVDKLASVCPIERIPIRGIESHSVLFELLKRGKARAFLNHILTFKTLQPQ